MLKFKIFLLSVYVFVVFLFFVRIDITPVYADDGSLGRYGETVAPINNADIVMQSEEVLVRVSKLSSETSCQFIFVNESDKKISVLMGFPSGEMDTPEENGENFTDKRLYDFTASIDGKPVEVKREKGVHPLNAADLINFPYWYTWEVSFNPGEKKIVRNIYRTNNTLSSNGFMGCGYVLTTGAPWKGRIGDAKITFEFQDIESYQFESINPGSYILNENIITWEFKDFEPDRNINIIINGRENLDDWYDSRVDTVKKLKTEGKYNEIVEFVDNFIKSGQQELLVENFLYVGKAEALIQLGRCGEAEKILDDNAGLNVWGSKKAAYLLMKYYKDKGINKYRDFYDKKVYLKTNGVMQKLAAQIFPDLNDNHEPEFYNLKVTPDFIDISVEDKDDDIDKLSIEVWYPENGQKLHLVNYRQNEFPYSHYVARYSATMPDLREVKEIYYRVCAEDSTGNSLDSGERKINTVGNTASGHWSEKYSGNFLWMDEVDNSPSEGDKNISNFILFRLLAKSLHLNPDKRAEQEKIFEGFLKERMFVNRAEAMDVIARFLNSTADFKIDNSFSNESKLSKGFSDWERIPEKYKESVSALVRVGAVIGYPDGTLKPGSNITTNEVLAILSRIRYGQKAWYSEKTTNDPAIEPYKKVVYNDTEAFKWYNEHSGDKFVMFEDGQWYIIQDNERGNIIKQKYVEEYAVELKNTMPDIFLTVKDGDTEINIIQKLAGPPHRYVLVVDKDLKIKSRRIEEY